jgi:hypothetical protein
MEKIQAGHIGILKEMIRFSLGEGRYLQCTECTEEDKEEGERALLFKAGFKISRTVRKNVNGSNGTR